MIPIAITQVSDPDVSHHCPPKQHLKMNAFFQEMITVQLEGMTMLSHGEHVSQKSLRADLHFLAKLVQEMSTMTVRKKERMNSNNMQKLSWTKWDTPDRVSPLPLTRTEFLLLLAHEHLAQRPELKMDAA